MVSTWRPRSHASLTHTPQRRTYAPSVQLQLGDQRKRAHYEIDDDAGSGSDEAASQRRRTDGSPMLAAPPFLGAGSSYETRILEILKKPFKIPIPGYDGPTASGWLGVRKAKVRGPLWPPNAEDAVVLYRPRDMTAQEVANPEFVKTHPVAVVVDPMLGRVLRPHQIEGVQFLWDCVTGRRIPEYNGCIMADEMVSLVIRKVLSDISARVWAKRSSALRSCGRFSDSLPTASPKSTNA